jgi:hypothetical protein
VPHFRPLPYIFVFQLPLFAFRSDTWNKLLFVDCIGQKLRTSSKTFHLLSAFVCFPTGHFKNVAIFGLYQTKTSDIYQKVSYFNFLCLLSYWTLTKLHFVDFIGKKLRRMTFLSLFSRSKAGTTSSGAVVVKCHVGLLTIIFSFQFPTHNQSLFSWHAVMPYFLIFLFLFALLSLPTFCCITETMRILPCHLLYITHPSINSYFFQCNPVDYIFHKHGHVWCGQPPSVFISYSFPWFF